MGYVWLSNMMLSRQLIHFRGRFSIEDDLPTFTEALGSDRSNTDKLSAIAAPPPALDESMEADVNDSDSDSVMSTTETSANTADVTKPSSETLEETESGFSSDSENDEQKALQSSNKLVKQKSDGKVLRNKVTRKTSDVNSNVKRKKRTITPVS